jgi:TRAP-type C4-dicarboxylate transport system permease small subunit
MKLAKKVLKILFFAEAIIATLLYMMIAASLAGDVLMREVAGSSLSGVQRICVYAMIQTGFLGLGLAAARGMHLRPRFADGVAPERFRPVMQRIGAFLMAGIFGFFVIFGVQFVQESIQYADMARPFKFPIWILQIVVPYALASTALRYLIFGIFPDLNPEEKLQ